MIRKSHLLTIAALAAACALPATALAGKAKAAAGGEKKARPGQVLKHYDTNHNGKIDGDEVAALQKAFEADKTGPLKHLDANTDGKLDDSEIAAVHRRKGGKKKKDV